MRAEKLLGRLEHVKQTGRDSWNARCPAHEDPRQPLGIREREDGWVLVSCLAGCSKGDMLESIGLDWSALFPEPFPGHNRAAILRLKSLAEQLGVSSEEMILGAVQTIDYCDRGLLPSDWRLSAQIFLEVGTAQDHAGPRALHSRRPR